MKKTCSYCGKIHPRGYACPHKPKRFRNKNTKDEFRSTIVWQKKRKAIVERDMWLCRICLDEGTLTSDKLQVHHITPLEADYSLRLEDTNLITLCPYHHELAECGQISADRLRKLATIPPGSNENF